MSPEKIISHSCAVLLIMSSIALAFIQVLDIDDVANGTLMYIAQAFLLAGSIFGLNYYLQKFSSVINRSGRGSATPAQLIAALMILAPLNTGAQVIIKHDPVFKSTYDIGLRCPRQVEWTIKSTDLGTTKRLPGWKFVSVRHHDLEVSKHDDYRNAPFDRGHMCPAGDRSSSVENMKATFNMLNVAAQVPSLNRGAWLSTEKMCRDYAIRYDSVCVLAVPIFLDRDTCFIGADHVAVPHAFMKACWLPGRDSLLNVWFYFNE